MMPAAISPLPELADRQRLVRIVANTCLSLLVVRLVVRILGSPDAQWDLRSYRFAVRAWQAGLNPYDPAVITSVADRKFDFAYLYPPDTLPFFTALTWFDLPHTRCVFLAFQGVLIASLLLCWSLCFLAREDGFHPLFFLVCLLAFDQSLLVNLASGNIALVETALLWWGLAAWLRGRYGLFAVLLWLAAVCKLTPLAFSVLLLLPPVRRWGLFALVWGAMTVRLGLDRLFSPRLFQDFTTALIGVSGGLHDNGQTNPCAPELLKSFAQLCAPSWDARQLTAFTRPIYATLVVGVLGVSWFAWRSICRRTPGGPNPGSSTTDTGRGLRLVCLVCLAYALTAPRMKDYSYVVLLPVAWQVGRWSLARPSRAWWIFVALLCLSNFSGFHLLSDLYELLWRYVAYFTALALWMLLLSEAFGSSPPAGVSGAGAGTARP